MSCAFLSAVACFPRVVVPHAPDQLSRCLVLAAADRRHHDFSFAGTHYHRRVVGDGSSEANEPRPGVGNGPPIRDVGDSGY